MTRIRALVALWAAGAALIVTAPAHAAITSVFDGDVSCTTQSDGVRFCGNTSPRSTTKTFDGVPIDVNVAFPPAPPAGGDGPYPLVMLFHGYGGSKTGLSGMRHWLDRGYATFSMTERGFGQSCGSPASRAADPEGCTDGYIRLMDDRYEVRDAQFLAGELADEGLIQPAHIGVTGGSYGGGKSMALAALRDRVMLPNGSLVPWRSPGGKPMRIAAAAPVIPWSDLAYALMPNGSTLDYVADAPYRGRIGVEKQSFIGGLYLVGCSFNFCAPPGLDPDADLTSWKTRIDAGEPYDGDPAAEDLLDEITSHHSAYYIDRSQPPAPLLISSGFTDDLFPADEALRYYNRTRTQFGGVPISLFFGDFGHMRGQNKPDVVAADDARIDAWFDYYVKGSGPRPPADVEAFTQTCPSSAPSGGPYRASDWAHIAPGEISLHSGRPQTVSATGGDPQVARAFDPVFGDGACARAPGADEPGTADYRLAPAPSGGYTLLGSPTVIAHFKSPGRNSQIAARLVDVAPDGQKTLVARGLWRPKVANAAAPQVFQLHPNGWRFEAGHVAKLELLPNDSPYGRASNGQQDVRVNNLELRLPVRERPGSLGGLVEAPAPRVVPQGYALAGDYAGG
jgi:Acetyl xylan esterase (AXE1)